VTTTARRATATVHDAKAKPASTATANAKALRVRRAVQAKVADSAAPTAHLHVV
jgi:hypothetical protein